ncbi:MAG: hypothetical protein ACXWLB_22420 [Reyranella sp.]
MAFLADPGVPRPPLSTRLVLPFHRSDWLLVVVIFAAFLATILSLQGSLVSRERTGLVGTAVCEQRTLPPLSLFFLAVH